MEIYATLPNYVKMFAERNIRLSVKGVNEIFRKMWKNVSHKKEIIQLASTQLGIRAIHLQKYIYKKRPIPLVLLKETINRLEENQKDRKWDDVFHIFTSFSYKRCKGNILPKFLTPKLAYLLGALRDAYVRGRNSYYVAFGYFKEDKKWIDEVVEPIVMECFGEKMKKIGNLKLFGSLMVVIFLQEVFDIVPGNQQKTEVPRVILKATPEIQKYYIAGFWDADGGCPHMPSKNSKLYIKFTQAWEGKKCIPLLQLQKMLQNFDINSTLITLPSHPSRKKPAFDLTILDKKSIRNFVYIVPVQHPSKSKRIKKLLNFC